MENRKNDVPYICFESELARMERIARRFMILTGITAAALVLTNALWAILLL